NLHLWCILDQALLRTCAPNCFVRGYMHLRQIGHPGKRKPTPYRLTRNQSFYLQSPSDISHRRSSAFLIEHSVEQSRSCTRAVLDANVRGGESWMRLEDYMRLAIANFDFQHPGAFYGAVADRSLGTGLIYSGILFPLYNSQTERFDTAEGMVYV